MVSSLLHLCLRDKPYSNPLTPNSVGLTEHPSSPSGTNAKSFRDVVRFEHLIA